MPRGDEIIDIMVKFIIVLGRTRFKGTFLAPPGQQERMTPTLPDADTDGSTDGREI